MEDARFQPIKNLGQVVRTRKQIMASHSKLIYRMEITEIGYVTTTVRQSKRGHYL